MKDWSWLKKNFWIFKAGAIAHVKNSQPILSFSIITWVVGERNRQSFNAPKTLLAHHRIQCEIRRQITSVSYFPLPTVASVVAPRRPAAELFRPEVKHGIRQSKFAASLRHRLFDLHLTQRGHNFSSVKLDFFQIPTV